MVQPEAWLQTFLRHSHRRQYANKTTIIHHGDQPETLYYIVEGSVSVLVEDDDGREIILAYLNKGDFFGDPDGMQIRITRQEIARIVGCSREMVGRVLKDLEEQEMIRARGKTMVIYGTR